MGCKTRFSLLLIFLIVFFEVGSPALQFQRTLLALGIPYFKVMLFLGDCKDKVLFLEQKVWGRNKYNRIFDIFYQGADESHPVTRAEIVLVLNNTQCNAFTERGLGRSQFAATLILPVAMGFTVYRLTLYSCHSHDGYVNSSSQSFESN